MYTPTCVILKFFFQVEPSFNVYLVLLCLICGSFFPSACLYNLSLRHLFCFSSFIVPITPHLLPNLSHLPSHDSDDIILSGAEFSTSIHPNRRMIFPH